MIADAGAPARPAPRSARLSPSRPTDDPIAVLTTSATAVWRTARGTLAIDGADDARTAPHIRRALRMLDDLVRPPTDHPAAPLAPILARPLVTERPAPLADLRRVILQRDAVLTAFHQVIAADQERADQTLVPEAIPDLFEPLRALADAGVRLVRRRALDSIQWSGDPTTERRTECAATMRALHALWRCAIGVGEVLAFREALMRMTPRVMLGTLHSLGVQALERRADGYVISGGDRRLLAAVLVRTLTPLLDVLIPVHAARSPASMMASTHVGVILDMLAAHGVATLTRRRDRVTWRCHADHPGAVRAVRLSKAVLWPWMPEGTPVAAAAAARSWLGSPPARLTPEMTDAIGEMLDRLSDLGVARIDRPDATRLRLFPETVPPVALDLLAPWSAVAAQYIPPGAGRTPDDLRAAIQTDLHAAAARSS